MKWVTKQNAKVDRVACPWLIRRFIDRDAEFVFAPVEDVMTIAERDGAIPYDMPGVELGHVAGRCSFESIVERYELGRDPALALLARIVHAADVEQDVDSAPEGAGLLAIAHGFAYLHGADDQTKLSLETPMYDALYAWCEKRVSVPA